MPPPTLTDPHGVKPADLPIEQPQVRAGRQHENRQGTRIKIRSPWWAPDRVTSDDAQHILIALGGRALGADGSFAQQRARSGAIGFLSTDSGQQLSEFDVNGAFGREAGFGL